MLTIGIAGGSGSGKTTVARAIAGNLEGEKVSIISQDCYYKDCSHLSPEEKRVRNFDHPDSIDWELLCSHIEDLRHGKAIDKPVYSFVTSERSRTETTRVEPADVIIVEGILIMSCKELREKLDIKIYVDTDDDERLIRIIQRDTVERGKDVPWVIERYHSTIKPMYLEFIEPGKRYADIIFPEGGSNKVGIELITATVEKFLRKNR